MACDTAKPRHLRAEALWELSRLVYYPDENHWILARENSVHWYGEVRDWIGRFAAPGPQ